MKSKLSITIDKDLVKRLESAVKEGKFRNKSHIVEYSLNQVLNELNEVKQNV
jgi:Arc/MetJ-type ribon-helix-helix transcriptional regulator